MITMNRLESMIAEHQEVDVLYPHGMPDKLPGFIIDNCIYLNDRHTWIEQHETLAEEIGHYATSSGNIVDYSTVESRKQERRARDYGYQLTVTLDDLIWCYEHHLDTIDDVSAYLEVTPAYFWQAIDCYQRKLGALFKYHGYVFDLRRGIDLVRC